MRAPSEEHHVALPRLYGAPAYARPPKPTALLERPLDPDDLPIELERTPEEQELVARILDSPFASTVGTPVDGDDHAVGGGLHGAPFRLRSLSSRILRRE